VSFFRRQGDKDKEKAKEEKASRISRKKTGKKITSSSLLFLFLFPFLPTLPSQAARSATPSSSS
jgi:hypothetical protein